MLNLLQKMEIENIVLIVCIWDNGIQLGANSNLKGGEFFKIIIERGRELLVQIQDQIQKEEIERMEWQKSHHKSNIQGATIGLGAPGFLPNVKHH